MTLQVEQVNSFHKGTKNCYLRRLVGGVEVGPYFEAGDISDIDDDKQVTEVEIEAKDTVVKSDSTFKKYRLQLTLQSIRPQYWNYFVPGTFIADGDDFTFVEDTAGTKQGFALYVPGTISGENQEPGQYYERYGTCTVQGVKKTRKTGVGTPFVFTIDSLEGIQIKYRLNGTFDTDFANSDETAPTVSSTEKVVSGVDSAIADTDTGVAVTAAFKATFSENMDQSSLGRIVLTLDSSGDPVAVSRSYNESTFEYTLTPSADLASSTAYTWTIPTSVRDLAQNQLASATSIGFTTA